MCCSTYRAYVIVVSQIMNAMPRCLPSLYDIQEHDKNDHNKPCRECMTCCYKSLMSTPLTWKSIPLQSIIFTWYIVEQKTKESKQKMN